MDITQKEQLVQSFAKQMLQSRLFIGNFQEKRYVDSLQTYRDVIVAANEETDLIHDLEVVKKRVRGYYGQDYWIGITGPDMIGAPTGTCLWVELPDEIFGSYWYKITKIKFRANEMLLRLKVVRSVSTAATIIPRDIRSSSNFPHVDTGNELADNSDDLTTSLQESSKEVLSLAKTSAVYYLCLFFSSVITLQNTKKMFQFVAVLVTALVTGLVQCLEYLGNFTLRFMRETSFFINTVTPIIIACINLVGKIIGGFYLLILSMWRDRKGPPPVYQSPYNRMNPALTNGAANSYSYGYNTVYFRRSLPIAPRKDYRSGVTITPLN